MPPEEIIIDSSECCGNGCATCILDIPLINTRATRLNRSETRQNAILSYKKYKLLNKTVLSSNILQLHFKLPENNLENSLILDIPAGHHIMMRAANPDIKGSDTNCNDSLTISRPYSPFRVNAEKLEFEMLVNLSPGGKMSQHIAHLNAGDLVEFRGPVGSFFHEPNSYENLLIFTNGVAIAPIIRIVDEILENESDMTKVMLFCCSTDLSRIFFRDKLHEYNKFWNFEGDVYLSREKCDACPENEKPSCEHFKKQLKYKERVHPFRLTSYEIDYRLKKLNTKSCRIIICGSKVFEKSIKETLHKTEIVSEQIVVL